MPYIFEEKWEECELVYALAVDCVNYGLSHCMTLREAMQRADQFLLPEWRRTDKEHLRKLFYVTMEAFWNEVEPSNTTKYVRIPIGRD